MSDFQYIIIILSSLATIIFIFEVANSIKQSKQTNLYNKNFESLNKEVKELLNSQRNSEEYFKRKIKSDFNNIELIKLEVNELRNLNKSSDEYFRDEIDNKVNNIELLKMEINELTRKNKILEENIKNQSNTIIEVEEEIKKLKEENKESKEYLERGINNLEQRNNDFLEMVQELDLDVSALYKVANKELDKINEKEKYTAKSSRTYEKENKDMALEYFCK